MKLKNLFKCLDFKSTNYTQDVIFSPYFLILLTSSLTLLQHSWVQGYFHDGYLYAEIGRQAADGHWLVPRLSDQIYPRYFQHPPLFFILEGLFFKIFGASFQTARLFPALTSMLTALILFKFLKTQTKGKWLPLAAALILVLTAPFIKVSRYPSIDPLLTLFITLAMIFYFHAFTNGSLKFWLTTGFFLGLSFLTKGPPAVICFFVILAHLTGTKKFKGLILKPGPYLMVLTSLLVFSTWPLALKATGNYDGFESWLNSQVFGTIVKGRQRTSHEPFAYIQFLFLHAFPWIYLAIPGILLSISSRLKKPVYFFAVCWFLGFLVPLSIMKFKYMHYIMPLYPALAILAAIGVSALPEKVKLISENLLKFFVPVGLLVLLVFPVTVKTRRHTDLFQLKSFLEYLPIYPKNWAIVNEAYGTWELPNFAIWAAKANPVMINTSELIDLIESNQNTLKPKKKNWIYFIKTSELKKIIDSDNTSLISKTAILMNLKAQYVSVLIDRDLLPHQPGSTIPSVKAPFLESSFLYDRFSLPLKSYP